MATKTRRSRKNVSIKHDIVDQANTRIVIIVAVATFISLFCLFAIRALYDQYGYHARVISEKEVALEQVQQNAENITTLQASVDIFTDKDPNIIGGSKGGEGNNDGNNETIVLDALPASYDYPALSSSFEKLLRSGPYEIASIGGSEDAVIAQQSDNNEGVDVDPIAVPYSFAYSSSPDAAKVFIKTLERSIRPIHVGTLTVQANNDLLTTRVSLETYFAPEKSFTLKEKQVR